MVFLFFSEIDFTSQGHPKPAVCSSAREAGRQLFGHLQPGALLLHQPGVRAAVAWGGEAVGPALPPPCPSGPPEAARTWLAPGGCDYPSAQGWRRGRYSCITPWTRSRSRTGPCSSHHSAAGFCKKLPGLHKAHSWKGLPIPSVCQRWAATSPDLASILCATRPHPPRNIVLPISGY